MGEGFGSVILFGDRSSKLSGCLGSGENFLGTTFLSKFLGGGFQGLLCLGTSIFNPFLLGVFLGVDLLGAVRQGCLKENIVF